MWGLARHGYESFVARKSGFKHGRERNDQHRLGSQKERLSFRIQSGVIHIQYDPVKWFGQKTKVGLQIDLVTPDGRPVGIGKRGQLVSRIIGPAVCGGNFRVGQLQRLRVKNVVDFLVKTSDGQEAQSTFIQREEQIVVGGARVSQVGISGVDVRAGIIDLSPRGHPKVVRPGQGLGIRSPDVEPIEWLILDVQMGQRIRCISGRSSYR